MKYPGNINSLSALPIDYMGLIFYPKSARYAGDLEPLSLANMPDNIDRVGVFVNEDIDTIGLLVDKYNLTYIQLHGQESPDFCIQCKERFNVKIIKAFNVSESADLEKTKEYTACCDYFLFDTKTPQYGGSGKKFDWEILKSYQEQIPFFLSGGISDADIDDIKKLSFSNLYALDVNSKFEIEPGLKDIEKLNNFITHFK